MVKPSHFGGYSDAYTVDCERVLVTLLRGLGPWKESIFLVGGLAPRYLVPQRPPEMPAHAGTLDVDIVIDLQLLADAPQIAGWQGAAIADARHDIGAQHPALVHRFRPAPDHRDSCGAVGRETATN